MKAVILAAGRGSRMNRLTSDVPKPLVIVNGKSILTRTLSCLPRFINECVIVIGYKGESIREKFGTYFCGRKITYVYQEDNLTGTGGALASAESVLGGCRCFLVIMGDDLYGQRDLVCLVQTAPSYGVYRLIKNEPTDQSVLFTKTGRLIALRGKTVQPYRYVGVGAYYLTEDYFRQRLFKMQNGEYSLPHTMAQMKNVRVCQFKQWHQINTPEQLKHASYQTSFSY